MERPIAGPAIAKLRDLMTDTFERYVGPASVHDATVVAVEESVGEARVTLRTCDGEPLAMRFTGIRSCVQQAAVGMMVHALAASTATDGARRYTFSDWQDDGGSDPKHLLEIVADAVSFDGPTSLA